MIWASVRCKSQNRRDLLQRRASLRDAPHCSAHQSFVLHDQKGASPWAALRGEAWECIASRSNADRSTASRIDATPFNRLLVPRSRTSLHPTTSLRAQGWETTPRRTAARRVASHRAAHQSLPIHDQDRHQHLGVNPVTSVPQQLRQAGINVDTLQKGDFYDVDQVVHALRLLDDKLDDRIERFNRGELRADPLSFACQKVIEHIHKTRTEMHLPVVCRCENSGIRVLTDAEAAVYLNAQANAGLRKHERKTHQLMTAVDVSNLNDHQKRQLETDQRKHAFVLAAHKGARTQSLKMQRRGLQLPDFTRDLGSKTQK